MPKKLLQQIVLASLVLVTGLNATAAKARTWTQTPEAPRWGETLRFEWVPETPTAEQPPELPRVLVMAIDEDGQTRWLVSETRWQEDRGVAELRVPDGLAYLNFFTTDSPKVQQLRSRRVARTDGRPARGAWEQEMWSGDPVDADAILAKELEHHPDNFSVYRALWWLKSITERSTFPSDAVRNQIEELDRLDRRTDEWLYAMAIGRVLIGERERGLALIEELVERFPESPVVTPALGQYRGKLLELGFDSEQARTFEDFQLAHLERYPDLPGGGEMLYWMSRGMDSPLISLATAERIFGAWIESHPENPRPYLGLARFHRASGQKLEQGLDQALHAIDLLLRGHLFHYGDLEGGEANSLLPGAYFEAAQLARDLGRQGEALAFVTLARDLEIERTPQTYELEGDLWRSLARPDRAEGAYELAWRLGSTRAEAQLASLFEAREGSRDRFERYLRSLQEEAIESDGGEGGPESAPQFTAEALDGTTYALNQLRGQVVVLNFWNIGCLPCRAEVPDLNRLVRRFEGREVVFLAPTGDSPKSLEAFLEELPFAYDIVPGSQQIFADYGISGIPVHVVIDRQGSVVLRRTGASEQLTEELARVIERAL